MRIVGVPLQISVLGLLFSHIHVGALDGLVVLVGLAGGLKLELIGILRLVLELQ